MSKKLSTQYTSDSFNIYEVNDNIELVPKNGQYNQMFIFLHDIGDSAYGYIDFFTSKRSFVPERTKIALLSAPVRNLSCYGGFETRAWFDCINPEIVPEIEDKTISDCIVNEIQEEEILHDYNQFYIGGFGQGASVALNILFTINQSVAGIISLSGRLLKDCPIAEVYIERRQNVHLFLGHGTKDETIPIAIATKSYNYLNELKNVTFKEYKDMGHCISEEEINDLKMVFAKWVCNH